MTGADLAVIVVGSEVAIVAGTEAATAGVVAGAEGRPEAEVLDSKPPP